MDIKRAELETGSVSHGETPSVLSSKFPSRNLCLHNVASLKAEEHFLQSAVTDWKAVLIGAAHLPRPASHALDLKRPQGMDGDNLARLPHARRVYPVGLVIALLSAVETGLRSAPRFHGIPEGFEFVQQSVRLCCLNLARGRLRAGVV